VNRTPPPGRKDWLAGAALGTTLGTLVLGVGGRLAMRAIALLQGQAPGFSVGGTTTVIFLGAVAGLVGALVFLGLRVLVRNRRILRAALFWTLLMLGTLPGLRPIDAQRLAVFVPLVILYGTTLQLVSCRVYLRRRTRSQGGRLGSSLPLPGLPGHIPPSDGGHGRFPRCAGTPLRYRA